MPKGKSFKQRENIIVRDNNSEYAKITKNFNLLVKTKRFLIEDYIFAILILNVFTRR